ncbi:MAG TPA: HAD family hydrolase [Acidimicrobiales bacterium]|nr:HAD family hydrolase [Acidimicrobiales bacterium]
MAVNALIFDFDGLILDTESPLFESWREAYATHGVELTLEEWSVTIGAADHFDPLEQLARRCDRPLDVEAVQRSRRRRRDELLAGLSPCPGVLEYLLEARSLGLAVAVASSSPRAWVEGHLDRVGLSESFVHLSCFEGIGESKPAPDLYLAALEALGIGPEEAVAFEDSRNGLMAAKAAGLRCVVVPTPMTNHLDFAGADLVLHSLAQMPLGDLLAALEEPWR